jgi:hypothetical protein
MGVLMGDAVVESRVILAVCREQTIGIHTRVKDYLI